MTNADRLRTLLIIDAGSKHAPLILVGHVVNNAMGSVLIDEAIDGVRVTTESFRARLIASFEAGGTAQHYPAITTTQRDAFIEAATAEYDRIEKFIANLDS